MKWCVSFEGLNLALICGESPRLVEGPFEMLLHDLPRSYYLPFLLVGIF